MIVGLLHPGELGASVGRALQANRHEVLWASEGRSDQTRARARSFRDVGSVEALAEQAELILSICPPHAELDEPGTTLYLSGSGAASVAVLFVGTNLEPRVVASASAIKMAYAAWSKGSRWSGEMEEIADTFAAAGQPDGFHRAAARVYRA